MLYRINRCPNQNQVKKSRDTVLNINLLTDASKHNLALMKISSWHKANGDKVYFNGVGCFDLTYGSWLYDFSPKGICDIEGGPGVNIERKLTNIGVEHERPDYDLFGLDYSLGYTWSYCPRKCPFCIVPRQMNPKRHQSIWSFHNSKFTKICLLNNNTFSDPQWKETFKEIWDADLTVIDENGYDLRLIDEEKADALRRTKFEGYTHYAWDRMKDESRILRGLELAPKGMVYVLIGYDTVQEEDFHRCQKIHEMGFDPYVMPYNKTREEKRFKRFIDSRMYRKYKPTKDNKGETIREAWKDYKP